MLTDGPPVTEEMLKIPLSIMATLVGTNLCALRGTASFTLGPPLFSISSFPITGVYDVLDVLAVADDKGCELGVGSLCPKLNKIINRREYVGGVKGIGANKEVGKVDKVGRQTYNSSKGISLSVRSFHGRDLTVIIGEATLGSRCGSLFPCSSSSHFSSTTPFCSSINLSSSSAFFFITTFRFFKFFLIYSSVS